VSGEIIRVYGGWLDKIWRWRTWQPAKSFGEVASNLWPGNIPMGKPNQGNAWLFCSEYITAGGELGEVKHLSSRRKRK